MSDVIRVLDSFYGHELNCRCGTCAFDLFRFDLAALVALQKLRNLLNAPIKIIRAYSCLPHHTKIYTNMRQPVTNKSAHLCTSDHKCCGFDISVDRTLSEIIPKAISLGFTGIGFGQGKLHIDTLPRFSMWKYKTDGSTSCVI